MTILTPDFQLGAARRILPSDAGRATVVVPCYNEAERLDCDAFSRFLQARPNISFVFVDDGSADDTLAVLSALRAAAPQQVTVLSLSRNSGKAEAVRQGLLHATGTGAGIVGYWDADLATPLDAIDDLLRVALRFEHVSVVFGSRRPLLGHRIERTVRRRLISRICALLARQAVRLPVADTQCGAKLLRNTPIMQEAIAAPFTAGWLFDVELFARLSARMPSADRGFYEHPLSEWDEVPGSKVTGRAVLRSGLHMLRLIAEIRLGLEPGPSGKVRLPDARIVPATETPLPALAA